MKKNICQKCRECCVFAEDEKYFAPIFTFDEVKKVLHLGHHKKIFTQYKKFKNIFQIKLIKSKSKKNHFVCPLLNEKKHLCLIYKNRPIDCKIWPLILIKDLDETKNKLVLKRFAKTFCRITKTMPGSEYKIYLKKLLSWFDDEKNKKILKKYSDLAWSQQSGTHYIKKLT